MKHTITKLFLIALLGSCSAPKKDMQVTVEVKDLKKGTLYLERVQDSALVTVDSIFLSREEAVVLQADLDHPELFYILLDRNQTDDIDNQFPFSAKLERFQSKPLWMTRQKPKSLAHQRKKSTMLIFELSANLTTKNSISLLLIFKLKSVKMPIV